MSNCEELEVDESILEIRTMICEQVAAAWAMQNKISESSVEKLFKEGLCSLEPIKLVEPEDFFKTKIPHCQQKLTAASMARPNQPEKQAAAQTG